MDITADIVEATREMGLLGAMMWTMALELFPRLLAAGVIVAIGYIVAVAVSDWVRRGARRTRRVDPALVPVLSAVVRYAILVFVLISALGRFGIQTTSALAVVGAAGLAIGLALQGTLANIASGIMLLWLRPFTVGDYIETSQIAGTVREMGLFATEITTYDGIFRFVPNSSLWNTPVFNYTRNRTRMTDISIGIGYGADIADARAQMLAAAAADSRVHGEPVPEVFVDTFADSAIVLRMRVWIDTVDFWATQRALMEDVKRRLDAANIEIPFPQRVVHVVGNGIAERGPA